MRIIIAKRARSWLGLALRSEDSTLALATMQDIAEDVRCDEVNRHLISYPGILATLLKDDCQEMKALKMNWITIKISHRTGLIGQNVD